MKQIKVLIPLIVFITFVTGGCFLNTSDNFLDTEKKLDSENENKQVYTEIKDDNQYIATLGDVVSDYADAYLQLALIFNTDPENVEFSTWQSWVSANLIKWKNIEKNAENIIKYLDNQENSSSSFSFINTANAQSFLPNKDDFDPYSVLPVDQGQMQFTLPLIDYEGSEFESGAREVEFIDPSLNIHYQAIKTAEEAPKGEAIKAIMEKFGFEDARVASTLLETARNFETRKWENVVEANDFLSNEATTIKNSSFTTVAVLGVVVTGGQLLTATTTAGKVWAGVNVAFGGADLVLQAGEQYSIIVDNRSGAALFKQSRENIKPINNVLSFVGLKGGISGGNLITIHGYGESLLKYIDSVLKTEEVTKTPSDKQIFMTNFGDATREVSLSYNGNFTNPYDNPEYLKARLENIFPKDAVVKIDDDYVKIGFRPSISETTVPVPQEQEDKNLSYSGEYVLRDPTAEIDIVGGIVFQIGSGGDIFGSSQLSVDGAVTMRGLTTTVKGSGSAEITGSYDNVKNEIYMGGNYTITTTSTTSGQSVPMTDSGTLVFKGTMSKFNYFSGDLTLQSGMGSTLTTSWSAGIR